MISPDTKDAINGIITVGINPFAQSGNFKYLITNIAEYPAIYPPKIPPINPALIAIADKPAINPGAIPGFPAMENAIPTAMISGNNPRAAPPIVANASQNVNLP